MITPPVPRWRQDLSYPLQESDRITLPNVPMFVSIAQPVTLIAMMVTILVTNKMIMFCASCIFIALILFKHLNGLAKGQVVAARQ